MELLGKVADSSFSGVDAGADSAMRLSWEFVEPCVDGMACVGVLDHALGGGDMLLAGCPEAD